MGTINLNNPTALTAALLVGDPITTQGGSNDCLPVLPKVGTLNVSAGISLLSNKSAVLLSCLTTAERNALIPTVGMIAYNSETDSYNGYFSGGWSSIGDGDAKFDRIRLADGTEAEPSLTFTTDLDTGIYLISANKMGVTVEGFKVASFESDGEISFNVFGDGATNPSVINFFNETNTHKVSLEAPGAAALTSDLIFTLPSAGPTFSNTPLTVDIDGKMKCNEQGVIYATGTITSAQLKTMYTTGIEVLAANGNNGYLVHKVALLTSQGGTNYTGGGPIYLQYGATGHGGTGVKASADLDDGVLIDSSSTRISVAEGSTITGVTQAALSGDGVYISNDTAVFAAGTSDATLHVWYSLITLVP